MKMKKINKSTNLKAKTGRGIVNSAINNLPFEMHIPGYQFCGPGTKLNKRLRAGQKGINGLDEACRVHDITYGTTKNVKERNIADRVLVQQARRRLGSKDAGFGERMAAAQVHNMMNIKSALGAGLHTNRTKIRRRVKTKKKKKKLTTKKKGGDFFRNAVTSAKKALNKEHSETMGDAVRIAIKAAKSSMGNRTKFEPNSIHRIIPVPKIGGILPLIPIFAGLSALGALTGGSAAVANAVIRANNAKKQLKESERHNEMMEAIALGKNREGHGVFLKPYRSGLGLYTQKKTTTKNF